MAACAPVSFSLPVEQYVTTTQSTTSQWTDFSTLQEVISATAAQPISPYDQSYRAENFAMGPILPFQEHSPLLEYLQCLDDYNDAVLANLIREAEYIPSNIMNSMFGVCFPEYCILCGYTQAFDALRKHQAFGLVCTKGRTVLQVAVDDTDPRYVEKLPASHPCAHLHPRDMFIGIWLLDHMHANSVSRCEGVPDDDWRDYLGNTKSIARVEAVEAQLFLLPGSKL